MPILHIKDFGKSNIVGLWHIQETEQELAAYLRVSCPKELTHHSKRLEWFAVQLLVKRLFEYLKIPSLEIEKDSYGNPFLRHSNLQISLSHSYPYVAVQIGVAQSIGIDIEKPTPKLLTISPRVLSANELVDAGESSVKHCVYWCAKESLYKIYGKRGLHFASQLSINAFTLQNMGNLRGVIIVDGKSQKINLCYEVHADFVLVYTYC